MSLFKGQKTTTSSQKIENFMATVCEFGTAVPLLYGTCRTNPNLINYQDFTATQHSQTVKSGKSKSTTIYYTYNCYLEAALGEKIDNVAAVWVGDTKYSSLAGLNSSGAVGAPLTLNKGDNRNPTAYMSQKHSSIACGYDGLSYVYGYVYLGQDSASVPSYSFECLGALRGSEYKANGVDANPAYIIKDILTKLGLEQYIDSSSFDNYADYCMEADLLVSTPTGKFNQQKKASEIIKELLDITNTYVYWNTDRFVFVPRDDRNQTNWRPNKSIMYDLNADNLALDGGGIVGFKRKDSNDIFNYITVKFTNRANSYEEESVSYQDVDDIRVHGARSTTIDALWLHTKERAIRFAKAFARKALTETNQYTLKLPWNYCRLTPGDLIRVTDEKLGLDKQVMMVSDVQEDNKGLITVTAIERAAGNYSEAVYSVDNNYNSQDFNIVPSDTDEPLYILPPSDLITSSNGVEVWIALRGKGMTWGGCSVYISDKDGNYGPHGKNSSASSYGHIRTAMVADSTEVTVLFDNANTVALLTGSAIDAENGNTLIWINGECMSYTLATLVARNTYKLTGLVRGQYGTIAAAHSVGEDMAVLDGSIYVVPLTKHYLGRNLYFKFPSFNVFEANEQAINELDYYTCTANTADLPNCINLKAYNKYRELADDVVRYDIVVEWDPPDFVSYQQAQVWYKTSGTQASAMGVIPEGTTGANVGLAGRWNYGGQGYNSVTIPQAVIGDTYKIAVCTQDIYGNTESADMSSQTTIKVAMKTETPNTPDGLSIEYGERVRVFWDEVRNADIKYYELRNDSGMLLRTNSIECYPALTARGGNLYLYAVSAYDVYSAPAKLTYNKPAPSAPSQPSINVRIEGLAISMDVIPNDCYVIKLNINDESFIVSSNDYFYSCDPGVYSVKYCFVDYFGEGAYSTTNVGTVLAYIPDDMIKDESLSYDKMSAEAKEAISGASVDKINIAVAGILGEGSALVMDEGSYALVASNGENLTGIFANEEGTLRLQGDYIHLTGDTVMDNDCIIKGQMVAGSISCDDGVTINAGKLAITKQGMTFKNSNSEVFSVVGRQMVGIATHGNHVAFDTEWDVEPNVICIPRQWQTQSNAYSNTTLYTECYAKNVTKRGFDVICRTFAQAGSYSSVNYGSGESYNSRVNGTTNITLNSAGFTLSGSGYMNATVDGSVQAVGWDSAQGALYNVYYIGGIEARLYINNALASSKVIYSGNYNSINVSAGVRFTDVYYTAPASAYIQYVITFTELSNVGGGAPVSANVQGGSSIYKLANAQQVAIGDVTFIVTDGSNRFYTVS